MKYIAAIILTGFLGIMILGFMPMNHDAHHGAVVAETPCPIISLLSTVCGTSGISMAFTHASALYSFLNNPISSIFVLALFLFIWAYFAGTFAPPGLKLVPIFQNRNPHNKSSNTEKERSWLSLFENSPSFK